MGIFETVLNDIKVAMKEKNTLKVSTLRLLQSALKNREIELRPNALSEEEAMGVVKKLAKQRKESIDQYTTAGRMDLADQEKQELTILETFLPQQMSAEQIKSLVEKAVTETKAASIKDMGSVMKWVLNETKGAADNKLVSELIKARLQGNS